MKGAGLLWWLLFSLVVVLVSFPLANELPAAQETGGAQLGDECQGNLADSLTLYSDCIKFTNIKPFWEH